MTVSLRKDLQMIIDSATPDPAAPDKRSDRTAAKRPAPEGVQHEHRRLPTSINAKDYEFSRATIRQLWEAGLDDVRRACARRKWLEAREVVNGVRVFDLSD